MNRSFIRDRWSSQLRLPLQHWSMRVPWKRKSTLWGGWAVRGPRHSFWFAGDTGWAPIG